MSDSNREPNDDQAVTDAKPRKLLAGKRIIRHLGVKTHIQTGNTSTGANCGSTSVAQPPSSGFNPHKTSIRC